MNIVEEIWKDIPEYEGLYQASNLGRIRSLNYWDRGYAKVLKEIRSSTNPYLRVNLYKNKKAHTLLIHRLVWAAFNGIIPKDMQINHIDENTINNSLCNLELVSPKSNANWGTRNKRVADKTKNGKMSKIVYQYDLNNTLIKVWPSVREIKRELGYNNGNISKCCRGITKYAFGYIWKYEKLKGD